MYLSVLALFITLLTRSKGVSLSFVDYTSDNYGLSPPIDEVNLNEISGLVWFRNTIDDPNNGDNIFYAISDDLTTNKGWIKFEYNQDNYEMTPITGTVMGDHPSLGDPTDIDSESIAILGLSFDDGFYNDNDTDTPTNQLNDDLYGYLVISSEGHRNFDTFNHIMLYDMDGSYIKDFAFPSLFNITDESGTQDNGAFEALDISSDYSTIAYANEWPLLQDDCDCSRIVVGTFDTPESATDPSDVTLTNDYMLRYDTQGEAWAITDLVFLDADRFTGDNAPVLPALILEGDRVSFPTDFEIYLVDLDLGDNDDVIDCFALETDCSDSNAISKTLVFDFSIEDFGDDLDVTLLNFESMAIYDNSDNTNDCLQTLILVNDNAEVLETVWVTFQIDYCSDYDISGGNGYTINFVEYFTFIIFAMLSSTLL